MIRCLRFFSLALTILVLSCHQETKKANPATDKTDTVQSSVTGKSIIQYAHSFTIEYHDHYKLVEVFNSLAGSADTLRYVLLQRGTPIPPGYSSAQVINIPVRTIIGMSSMHVALSDFAGVSDRITGLGSLQYVSSPEVRKKIADGKIANVGLDGNINRELILTMHPDVLMDMGNPDAGFGRYKTLTDAGIPVLLNVEWLETSPLGRAEWVKLMAALVNKEDIVNKKFDSLAKAYEELAQLGRNATVKPSVIIGMPYKGSWFTPAGGSFMAQFLRDAGANYKWGDSKGIGSLSLNFEAVAPEALKADYWLNVGDLDTRAGIAGKDERYTSFKPFKTGQLYNNNKQVNDLGSNDYWESGAVNPQLVLADLIKILHPDLLPGHSLVYYKQLK